MVEETFTPDPPLTAAEEALVAQLNEEEIELIDKALLSNATYQWRKVAMVVVKTMKNCESQIPHIPDLFFAQRLRRLVETGRFESQGNLASMRFSEVRLPGTTQPN